MLRKSSKVGWAAASVAAAAAVVGVAAGTVAPGCNTNAATDAAADGRDPLAPFLGVWQVTGSRTLICPGGDVTSPLSESVTLTRTGANAELSLTLDGCPVRFSLAAGGAAVMALPNQTCVAGSPARTIFYADWAIRTADGISGSWSSAGTEVTTPGIGPETCAFETSATLAR